MRQLHDTVIEEVQPIISLSSKISSYLELNDMIVGIMADVGTFFAQHNHRPSEHMLAALSDIPRTMLSIIQGNAPNLYHLSPLDAGVGKTTALRFTAKAIRERFPDVGMILCLGRLTQIEQMVHGMDLGDKEYAVLAARGQRTEENGPFGGRLLSELGLGQEGICQAPVLLTTHAMVESRLTERAWSEAREFFYQSKPRLLRVWDESVFVRKGITVERAGFRAIEAHLWEFRNIAESFVQEMDAADHGAILIVPDFAAQTDLQTLWAGMRPTLRTIMNDLLRDLWFISGKPARVHKEGNRATLVQYQTKLPDDIKPMLVLDASARVRATYWQQHRADNDIKLLSDAHKRYNRVQVYFQEGGAGKENFGQSYWQRLREVADIIKRHPERKPLVLHHKPDRRARIGNVKTDLLALLREHHGLHALPEKPEMPDVAFCHWGVHNATNSFADRDLIITASIFRAPDAAIEAQGRAAANRPVQEEYTIEERQEIRQGEILHDLLQGLSRGSMRNLDGDEARECLVYLRADRASGVKGELQRLFPGCQVVNGWRPKPDKLGRKSQEVLDYIVQQFEAGAEELPFPAIYKPLGIAQPNFGRYIGSIEKQLAERGLRARPGKPHVITKMIAKRAVA